MLLSFFTPPGLAPTLIQIRNSIAIHLDPRGIYGRSDVCHQYYLAIYPIICVLRSWPQLGSFQCPLHAYISTPLFLCLTPGLRRNFTFPITVARANLSWTTYNLSTATFLLWCVHVYNICIYVVHHSFVVKVAIQKPSPALRTETTSWTGVLPSVLAFKFIPRHRVIEHCAAYFMQYNGYYAWKAFKPWPDWRSHGLRYGAWHANKYTFGIIGPGCEQFLGVYDEFYAIHCQCMCSQCRAAIAPRSSACESAWCFGKWTSIVKNIWLNCGYLFSFRMFYFDTVWYSPMHVFISLPLGSANCWRRR